MEQVRDLLTPHRAHHIKYIGTWTVTDLPSSTMSHGAERQNVPHGMKYSERGELVTVRTTVQDEQTRLEVRDTGIGIAAEHLHTWVNASTV